MSFSLQASASSTPNFQPIFEKALQEYNKKTGKDLTSHPLAAEIKCCDSPEAILTILEGKANELNESRSSDERLIKWLNPTVNILNALSATLGEGAGSIFPPTKIIFSGIGILLVVAKNTATSLGVLIELFDRIQSFFGRLKTYTEVPPTPAVKDVLAKIMAEVLSILAIATRQMKERRSKTFIKKLAGMNGIEDALQRFDKLEQGELLTVVAQVSRDTGGLKDDAKQMRGVVEMIVQRMDARDWEEVLRKLKGWLSPPDPSMNYNIGLSDLHKETLTWFLKGHIFQEWYLTGSLLWIHGKPGSGKSILWFAISLRILSLRHGGRASVAYFYFDFRDDNKKHRRNLLHSLLVQFAASSIPCCDIISRVYSACGKGTEQPSDEVMIDCLTNMLLAVTQHPVYIIVDALDECPNTSGVRSPRERVLGLINDLVNLRLPNLHICITSRPEIDIRNRLEPLTPRLASLHDQIGHKDDIAKYINSEVDFIANVRGWREDDEELVIEILSKKADGMFRWVFCQLEMLRLCLRSRVRHFVNELPDSLDETYERVLKEIHKTNQAHAQRLIQCLVVAVRPLRVDEFTNILTFDPDAIEGGIPTVDADWGSEDQEQELLSACPSLITIVDSSDGSRVVQFSHFSVKEFLISDRLAASKEDISRYHVLPDAAHTTLARASLGVLLHSDYGHRIDIRNNRYLSEYAAEAWTFHAHAGNLSPRVMHLMKTFFDSDQHFAAWVQMCDLFRFPFRLPHHAPNAPNPLYYSAFFGIYDLVEHLLKKHSQHVDAIQFDGIHSHHVYPLVAALSGGHTRIAKLLLQHGANVDVGKERGQTALHMAIEWPNNLAVGAVQFLLEHGADVNLRNLFGETPLHLVANPRAPRSEDSRADLAQLLLRHGAEVNSRGHDDLTPLHYASRMLDLEMARVLLDNGADINAVTTDGEHSFHRVFYSSYSSKTRVGIARLLVERGADVNILDNGYDDTLTPLHVASCNLDLELMRFLLDHGTNVNAKDNFGQTALYEVINTIGDKDTFKQPKDRFSAVQLLVERGADVNARNKRQETPLHLASSLPEPQLVRMLLDRGADVHAICAWGRTPIDNLFVPRTRNYHWHRQDFSDVAQLLIERGADTRNCRHALLHLGSCSLNLKLVRVLLDHGVNVDARDSQGRTPLHLVLVGGEEFKDKDGFGVAQLLMERGADVNKPDYDHKTPLHIASRLVSLEVAWLLIRHGADLNVENTERETPLQVARKSIREEMKKWPSNNSIRRSRRAKCVALMGLLYGY
ncbi:ankyrin repeat-containing domain protein [Lactarius deliciosus]|nr:ankyrin repeat-containing domain protein [Lactarius deliciosus]